MKKSIKLFTAGLVLSALAVFGFMASPSFAAQPTKDAHGNYIKAECDNPAILNPKTAPMDFAAFCSNKAGGTTDLFGSEGVLTTVINVALYFIGGISVLMLIIGGVRYTMSAGNEKAVTAAKSTILYAVIGVIIALLAYAIVNFVLGTFKSA